MHFLYQTQAPGNNYAGQVFKLIDSIFVDKSGFGAEDEPALTVRQLLERLRPRLAYAIIEKGQFQLYLGEFEVRKHE